MFSSHQTRDEWNELPERAIIHMPQYLKIPKDHIIIAGSASTHADTDKGFHKKGYISNTNEAAKRLPSLQL